jgi:LPXTG-site transpeptidase (sortase) family protein
MEQGLAFMECATIDAPGLTTNVEGGFDSICNNSIVIPTMSADPADVDRRVTFDFGTITNEGQTDAILKVNYRATVLNIVTNVDGESLNNSATWNSSGGVLGAVQTSVNIVEPDLKIEKTANVNFIANGSIATFTLAISHTSKSKSDAFDIMVSDVLPAGLDYVANSIVCDGGAQDPDAGSCVYDALTRTIKAQWSTFTLLPAGDRGVIQFDVIGNAFIPANGSVTNTANVEWTSVPDDRSTPQSFSTPPNPFARERFYDPADPLNFYNASAALAFTPLGGSNDDGEDGGGGRGKRKSSSDSAAGGFIIPITGFAPNTVTELNTASRPTYNSTNLSIEIPTMKVKTSIVGVQLKNGDWDVSWLLDQIGWLNGTAYPTWTGNSVLTAHVVNSVGQPGVFSNLRNLNKGEYVIVYNLGYRYTYKVVSNQYVQPDDITVLQHEDKAYLTLITCDTYNEKTKAYLRRIAVRAMLVDVREAK